MIEISVEIVDATNGGKNLTIKKKYLLNNNNILCEKSLLFFQIFLKFKEKKIEIVIIVVIM